VDAPEMELMKRVATESASAFLLSRGLEFYVLRNGAATSETIRGFRACLCMNIGRKGLPKGLGYTLVPV
jgi:hypothetical protein